MANKDIEGRMDSFIDLLKQMIDGPLFKDDIPFINMVEDIIKTLNSLHKYSINSNEIKQLRSFIDDISNLWSNFEKDPNDQQLRTELIDTIYQLYDFSGRLRTYKLFIQNTYNTESYYEDFLNELEKKKNKLNGILSASKQTAEDNAELRKQLDLLNKKIEQIIVERDEAKKALDAQNNVNDKISKAFNVLQTHSAPLDEEKKRLDWMFYVYASLCGIVLLVLITFESIYLSKWTTPKSWIDYLPFYIPVPIVGGLLWAFISQMNRAQRQLMLLANVRYHVNYVEGLLMALNYVSLNANSASERIIQVLDNMISNYMSIPDGLFERSMDKEISKDNLNINVNSFIDLAKKIKDVFN